MLFGESTGGNRRGPSHLEDLLIKLWRGRKSQIRNLLQTIQTTIVEETKYKWAPGGSQLRKINSLKGNDHRVHTTPLPLWLKFKFLKPFPLTDSLMQYRRVARLPRNWKRYFSRTLTKILVRRERYRIISILQTRKMKRFGTMNPHILMEVLVLQKIFQTQSIVNQGSFGLRDRR